MRERARELAPCASPVLTDMYTKLFYQHKNRNITCVCAVMYVYSQDVFSWRRVFDDVRCERTCAKSCVFMSNSSHLSRTFHIRLYFCIGGSHENVVGENWVGYKWTFLLRYSLFI